jgi:hypothetical protein
MTSIGNVVSLQARRGEEEGRAEIGPFVLNLCPLQAFISIPQPRSAHLTRYAFFVSRGLEGSREQYWLHMGYFPTRAEAQKWLEILRRVYPEAFVTSSAVTFVAEHGAVVMHTAARRRE